MTQPTVSTAEVCYIYMRQGGCVFVVVYLFDCLSVCLLATLNKTSEGTSTKFSWKVGYGPTNKRLNFGGESDLNPYRDTGKTCLGGGMHCLNASSLLVVLQLPAYRFTDDGRLLYFTRVSFFPSIDFSTSLGRFSRNFAIRSGVF